MSVKSPRHSIEDLVTLKWVLGALMGLVCVTTLFNIPGHNKVPALIATFVICIALIRPSWIAKVPQVVWKFYAVGIIPLVLVDVLAKETIPALLNLNTWLILFRCLNHDKRREEMQLALLCLFLVIMTGILTATLVFGFQLLFFTSIALAYLVVSTALESKLEGNYEKLVQIRRDCPMTVGRAIRSVCNTRFAFLSFALYASLVCLAGMVFTVIPRIDVEDKVSLFNMKSRQSLSGFSDRVSLGEVTDIKNDNSIALRVDAPEDAIAPVTPYWRMLALDRYENGSFSLSPDLNDLQRSPLASPYHSVRYWPDKRFAQAPSNERRDRWTFFLEPEISRYLPVLGSFKHMTVSDLNGLVIGPHMHSFATKEISSKMISYQIEAVDFSGSVPDVPANSYPMFLAKPPDKEWRGARQSYPQSLLSLPDETAAIEVFREAAFRIAGGEQLPPRDFAKRVNDYLWERHEYSMSVSLPASRTVADPVARWVESTLPGHCEFFASSFVLIARAAGYPSRVVVGFKGGAWNPYESYFMVRNSDAHAWAEIFDGSGSWIRVDPTPGSDSPALAPATRPVQEQVGLADSTAFIDSLRVLWYRRIVNFDQATQKEAAIQLKDFFVAYVMVAERWTVNTIQFLVDWAKAPWSIWRILYMCFLASLLVAAFVIQRNMALNFRELLLASFRRGDPIRRKANKFLRRLKDKELGDETLRRVVADLQRLRYGAKESWPNPRLVFKAARKL